MKYTDIPEPIRTKMQVDELIFGNAFCWHKSDGTFERIDPMKVILNPITGEFKVIDTKEFLKEEIRKIMKYRAIPRRLLGGKK
jgi:hypothetical protein